MKLINIIRDDEKIKLLADKNRKKIVQLLMTEPSTLTMLGTKMGQSPAWIRHHIKRLEEAGLVELCHTELTNNVLEKFYKTSSPVIQLQTMLLPESTAPLILISGSHDKALELLKDQLSGHFHIIVDTVGSLNGLINLRQGICQISGSHLMDENGEFNVGYIKHIFADRPVRLITLVSRTQGLIIKKGNPMGIRSVGDLSREDVRFLNRNPGSGTRIWLDNETRKLGILPEQIQGYGQTVKTHDEVALAIKSGKADVALGIQCVAVSEGLDFIPLFEERFDFAAYPENPISIEPVFEHINSAGFRSAITHLSGYNSRHSGELVHY